MESATVCIALFLKRLLSHRVFVFFFIKKNQQLKCAKKQAKLIVSVASGMNFVQVNKAFHLIELSAGHNKLCNGLFTQKYRGDNRKSYMDDPNFKKYLESQV